VGPFAPPRYRSAVDAFTAFFSVALSGAVRQTRKSPIASKRKRTQHCGLHATAIQSSNPRTPKYISSSNDFISFISADASLPSTSVYPAWRLRTLARPKGNEKWRGSCDIPRHGGGIGGLSHFSGLRFCLLFTLSASLDERYCKSRVVGVRQMTSDASLVRTHVGRSGVGVGVGSGLCNMTTLTYVIPSLIMTQRDVRANKQRGILVIAHRHGSKTNTHSMQNWHRLRDK
jgi:hypothetical protein